jgi:hypothetical protein
LWVTDADEVARLLKEAIWYRTEGGGKYKARYRSAGVLTLEDAA